MRWMGHVERIGEGGKIHGFDGKTENKPLRKLKRWWDYKIKMDLK